MTNNSQFKNVPEKILKENNLVEFKGFSANIPYLQDMKNKEHRKVKPSIKQAIIDSGLKDGMTISFHHGFRNGDKVLPQVVEIIAQMGFKNLTLVASSVTRSHEMLVEHIKNKVITRMYTSGLRGDLAELISHGMMENPVHIHSHGGRVELLQSKEIEIDVTFLGVSTSDEFGNSNSVTGKSKCGSLGYAMVDAQFAKHVVLLTEELVPFPNVIASIKQDQVDSIVVVDEIGDSSKISTGATRMTTNPRELLIARKAADVIEHSGYFKDGFTIQTGSGGAALAVTRFLEEKMLRKGITADFALGGITSTIVKLHEKGLIKKLHDVQCFDEEAVSSLLRNPNHLEISANQYANPFSKGASVDFLDVVILSALEIDIGFNVNVITGSDGVIRGASGGHSDTAASAKLTVVVAPLVRGRIPTVVNSVLNVVTPGKTVDVLVTDHGVAVNPERKELVSILESKGIAISSIEELQQKAEMLTGKPKPIEYTDKVVGIIRYRDGSVIDVIYQVKD